MDKNESITPSVFISYSHDSPEHKRWVAEFASKLVENGVDVILDQWDLDLGDDVTKFMEHGVTKADRVLMVCTDSYVKKVNEGKGGAGYEGMIVTGELVQDLGTSKFIPVIRQRTGRTSIPTCIITRLYINFSEDRKFNENFEILLREIYRAPLIIKPPIGKNPFANKTEITNENDINTEKEIKDNSNSGVIFISRDRQIFGFTYASLSVRIDGVYKCSLENGGTDQVKVKSEIHKVIVTYHAESLRTNSANYPYTAYFSGSSEELQVNVEPGMGVFLKCRSKTGFLSILSRQILKKEKTLFLTRIR